MDDEPFLEAALDDRSKEVRQRASDLLRSLPASRLYQRMIERARACLAWNPGAADGPLVVTPPSTADKAMIRDGIDPKSALYPNLGERAWWLREIVAAVPPRELVALLGAPPSEIVAAVTGGEWEHVLGPSWMRSSVRNRDASWAEPLLELAQDKSLGFGDSSLPFELLALMPPERREAFVLQRLRADPGPLRPKHPALGFVRALKERVSVDLARDPRPRGGDSRARTRGI